MKIKHTMKVAMLSALTTLGGGILFTSCEDMFTTDNGLVTDDLTPQDTVYTMMGIVKNMQRIMDRTVIFGELRADLVGVSDNTPSDLRDISSFDVSTDNAYNDPRDFYNVINSCNIYLANVDAKRMASQTTEEGYGEYYFEKEIIATKCYRAWTYLQLAQIYGATNIPFILEPVITADAADQMVANTSNRTTMNDLCTYFITDLKPYADQIKDNEALMPDYSASYASGQESNVSVSYRKFFLPVRLMLAELYLWRGSYTQSVADYREAVRYYHEFLTHGSDSRNYLLSNYRITWNSGGSQSYSGTISSYNNNFRLAQQVSFIPMDTTAYLGNTSSIREVFSSKYSNNYYPAATPSERLKEIFQSQNYLNVDYSLATSLSDITPEYAPKEESALRTRFEDRWWRYVGDLRFNSVYSSFDYNNSENSNYSNEWSFCAKWEDNASGGGSLSTTDQRPEFIPLYRLPIIYLHMAEALNRAGFPESAFVILKYGISTSALQAYAPQEFEELKTITAISSQDADFTQWNVNYFITPDMVSFADIRSHQFNQWPIHAFGCGESWFDDGYTTGVNLADPKYAQGDETIQYVVDEEGNIIYETDEEGQPILDPNNLPIPVTDPSQGTPVYNYGIWAETYVNGGYENGIYDVWGGLDVSRLEPIFQELLSYDDFLAYLPTATNYYRGIVVEQMSEEDLQALYDTYKSDFDAFRATIEHNKGVKAAAANDMQAGVADLILTEEALEGMFEGTRFGDLMRFSKQTGNDAYLGQAVSKRTGTATPDGSLAGKLASEAGWYITMPKR